MLNVVQSGLIQITSGCPNLSNISCAVNLLISLYKSIFSKFLFHSTLKTECPFSSNALPILLVPANNSNTLMSVHPFIISSYFCYCNSISYENTYLLYLGAFLQTRHNIANRIPSSLRLPDMI